MDLVTRGHGSCSSHHGVRYLKPGILHIPDIAGLVRDLTLMECSLTPVAPNSSEHPATHLERLRQAATCSATAHYDHNCALRSLLLGDIILGSQELRSRHYYAGVYLHEAR